MKWLVKTIRGELRALEHARRRFVGKPTERRLHDVRTAGRRFRSFLEDIAELAPAERLSRRVKRAARVTDAARDATVIRRLLESCADSGELALAQPLLEELRHREKLATRHARKQLARLRFAP